MSTIAADQRTEQLQMLVQRLDELGFYKYATPSWIRSAKTWAMKTTFLYIHTKREYHADEEDLAEGDVADLLRRTRPFLRMQGVPLRLVRQRFADSEPYTVSIDAEEFLIYTQDEARTDQLWKLTTGRTLQLFNTLLTRAGSLERAYLLYGWNDALLVFLTEKMYDAIWGCPIIRESEKPQRCINSNDEYQQRKGRRISRNEHSD